MQKAADDQKVEHGYGDNNLYQIALAENKINYWGKGYLRLYACCILVYLNSTMTGYDQNLMASLNVLPAYLSHFHLGGASTSTSIVFAIFQVGQIASGFFYWPIDLFGRRWCILGGCIGVIIAAIIQGTSKTIGQFIAGRFLSALFSTVASTSATMYLVEISPQLLRGSVAGMYNTLYYMGSLIASFSAYGCQIHFPDTNATWMVPVYLQIACPLIVVCGISFCPESPRWLIMKGRREKAKEILIKYHANGDATHPSTEFEMNEIEHSLESERGSASLLALSFDIRGLFRTRANRYRLMLAMVMGWCGQFSGSNVAGYYLPQMAEKVGYTSSNFLVLLNALYAVAGWVSAASGALLHDHVGRRKMLGGSMFGMAVLFAVMAGTTADYENNGSHSAAVAMIIMIFLFGMTFSFAFTSMQPVYPAEVLSSSMRARGMAFWQFNSGIAAFINTFAAPVAMANISYWFYVFYSLFDLSQFVFIYFYFVETKSLTMEELDEVFEAPNPRKASIQKRKMAVQTSRSLREA